MLPRGHLIGNLIADPKVGATSNSNTYARFGIACNDNFVRYKDGSQTHFFNCVAWGQRAQYVQKYLRKGDGVFIEFTLSTNSYTNSEGRVIKNIDLYVDRIEVIRRKSSISVETTSENSISDLGLGSTLSYSDSIDKTISEIDQLIESKYDLDNGEVNLDNISLDDIYS